MSTTFYRIRLSSQSHKVYLWEQISLLWPSSPLQALPHMWQARKLSSVLILTPETLTLLLRFVTDPRITRRFLRKELVKSACDCLLSWHFIWLSNPTLNKQKPLQLLQTVSERLVSRWSNPVSVPQMLNNHFFPNWLIFRHLVQAFNIYSKRLKDIILKTYIGFMY